ncbi:predicted protein [Uncinocarpus reesii 1704]|uniref:Uncharacterized protein n=1 Tax=Uncinocarpus reesii (strain UAMH 1704) TaxID=336963 RepID=C4JM04_UNCRE|nr:uncharacterized protein UREG_03862 [Uncinocarpus reesii 1704]EEP79016.1 predicted protein [Uncinocarpus reesii 1704]
MRAFISILFSGALLASQLSLTSATPTPRGLSVPAPPADPPKPSKGDGIGPYDSKDSGFGDWVAKQKFKAMATAADGLGLDNAARNLRHYLGNSGKTLSVSPENMLKDLSGLSKQVRILAQNEAGDAFKAIKGAKGQKAFSSKWTNYYATTKESKDWFYALGGFSFSVTGVVSKSSAKSGTLKYAVHIFDRYNWDGGKSVDIGPFHFEDRELGELHLKGEAREYLVRGTSKVVTVKKYTPSTKIPLPKPKGGRRD